jgi:cold shock CspA family protein
MHESEGTIATVRVDRGFGFISRGDLPDIFFHVTDLDASLAFDDQLIERRVVFQEQKTTKGLRALNVRAL